MQNESFFIPFTNEESNQNLQVAFKKFLKLRQDELKPKKSTNKHEKKKSMDEKFNATARINLRKLFLDKAFEYIGVPYAKKYWNEQDEEFYSSKFLDCCALVRQVMRDLRSEFGFILGPWNQGYMYDLLPIEYFSTKDMKPGDLVFVEGIYFNENRKPQRHNIMHVEIWIGEGEKTIGARWNSGKVQVFDSYKFVSKNYEIKRFIFKSIETWLQGICRSFCDEHNWYFKDRYYEAGKYSIFSNIQETEEQETCNFDSD